MRIGQCCSGQCRSRFRRVPFSRYPLAETLLDPQEQSGPTSTTLGVELLLRAAQGPSGEASAQLLRSDLALVIGGLSGQRAMAQLGRVDVNVGHGPRSRLTEPFEATHTRARADTSRARALSRTQHTRTQTTRRVNRDKGSARLWRIGFCHRLAPHEHLRYPKRHTRHLGARPNASQPLRDRREARAL